MAVEYKRMQQRVGTYAQYEQYKGSILPNEFVAVTSGSPDTDDGSALYFKNGTKNPKLIVDESKLKLELKKLKDELNVGGLGVLSTSAVGANMATSDFVLGTAEIPWET